MEDIRITRNKTLLKNTLINHCTDNVHNMTVSKLCSLAGVSRPTFYAYYDGIHSIIEEIELQHLPPLLNADHLSNITEVTANMDMVEKNKATYLFLLRNGRANKYINKVSQTLFRERPANGGKTISDETVELFASFLTPASVQLLIYELEHNNTITHQHMARLHLIIERHTYAMIAEYENLTE